MYFALKDYYFYKKKRRQYSPEELKKYNCFPATTECFENLEHIPAGAFMFVHTRESILSWLVMYYTNSIWSHVCIFKKNGYVLDMTTSGVTTHSANNYLDRKSYLTVIALKNFHPKVPANTTQKKLENIPYSWPTVLKKYFAYITGMAHFRWIYYGDFLLLYLIVSSILFLFSTKLAVIPLYLGLAHLLIITYNLVRYRSIPHPTVLDDTFDSKALFWNPKTIYIYLTYLASKADASRR
ncbi:hypothetical protein ABMA77_08740 [Halobacteriovorax sp. RZ-1]|uniref:hypothetical protein n=1 Tax=unclassified Halobacteriovorax TaxID=2639665 RepID=UPI00371101F3